MGLSHKQGRRTALGYMAVSEFLSLDSYIPTVFALPKKCLC